MSEFILFPQLVIITSSIYQEQRSETKKVNLRVTWLLWTNYTRSIQTLHSRVGVPEGRVSPSREEAEAVPPVKFSLPVEVLALPFLLNVLLQWFFMSLSLGLLWHLEACIFTTDINVQQKLLGRTDLSYPPYYLELSITPAGWHGWRPTVATLQGTLDFCLVFTASPYSFQINTRP